MHRVRLHILTLALILSSALPGAAQEAAGRARGGQAHVAVLHSISMPGGG